MDGHLDTPTAKPRTNLSVECTYQITKPARKPVSLGVAGAPQPVHIESGRGWFKLGIAYMMNVSKFECLKGTRRCRL